MRSKGKGPPSKGRSRPAGERTPRTEELLKTVLDASPTCIFLKDREGRYLLVNRATADLRGIEPSTIVGRKDRDYVDQMTTPEEVDRFLADDRKVIDEGEPLLVPEESFTLPDGTVRYFQTTKVPLEVEGHGVCVLGVSVDITARKRVEELLRVERDLAVVLASAVRMEDAFDRMLDVVCQVRGIDCGGVYVVDEEAQEVRLVSHKGLSRRFVKAASRHGSGSTQYGAVMAGKAVYGDLAGITRTERRALLDEGLRALAVVPIEHEGRVVACLNLASHTRDEIPPTTRQALETIGAQIGGVFARVRTEEAMRESEARYRALVERIPAVTYVADLDEASTTLYVSPQIEQYIGFSPEEYRANPDVWRERLHPEDRERVLAEVARAHATGGPFVLEYRMVARDGREVWFRDEACIVRDDRDEPILLQGIMSDITERKRAEDTIRESEEKYRLVSENIPVVVYSALPDQRSTTLFVSGRIEELTGYTGDHFIEDPGLWERIVHPEDRQRVWETLREQREGKMPLDTAYRIITKDGAVRWIHDEATPTLDEDGEIERIDGFMEDITTHKQAEEALREAYDIISNSPAVAFVWKNAEGWPVEYVSDNVEALFGYAAGEFTSGAVSYASVIHPDDLGRVADEVARCSAGRTGRTFAHDPYRIVTRDGGVKWIDDRTHIRRDDKGRITHYRGVVVDVTDRKRAEEALKQKEEDLRQAQKMEAVGRLAGGVAHDFNNLLTAITGYSELLMQNLAADDPGRRDAEEINRAGHRGAALVRQLLAFSRKQVLAPRTLDLNAEVADMERMLHSVAGEGVDLVTVREAKRPHVKADPIQIEQVLMNLVANARDAMPQGGRLVIETVTVDLKEDFTHGPPEVKPGSYVMLAVTDTGIGMDEETKSRLFEPFFTTKDVGEGTGLGLSTIYGIVRQSGGDIRVYSEPGKGTTVKVYLPCTHGPVTEAQAGVKPSASLEGTETVLVVEDEEAVRRFVVRALRGRGYTVLEAANSREALPLGEHYEEPIDLLVTDVVMSGLTGPELAARLERYRPRMRVLYMSGYSRHAGIQKEVLQAGDSYLQKPFSSEALARNVREVLERASRTD